MACGVDEPQTAGGGKLSTTEIEPSGAHCPAGGVAVHTGIDADDNGILDSSEITSTTYTCNHKTLLREDGVVSGPVCPGGGVAVRSGHDVNDNGSLEDSEIEQTATVCYSDELFHGDLKTSEFSAANAQEKLAHVRVVTGNLVIDSDVAMPNLTTVGGNVDVRVGSVVELPLLERIAGNLNGPPQIVMTSESQGVEHPVKLKMAALTTIGGKVTMTSWKESGTFSAPLLAAVDGDVVLTRFSTVELQALNHTGGRLDLDVSAEKLALPALERVGVRFSLRGSAKDVDLHALKAAPRFELVSSKLTSLSLPALQTVGAIELGNSDALTTVQMPLVSGVTSLGVYRLPLLTTLEMPLVTQLNTLVVSELGTPDLQVFANLSAVQTLKIRKNANLVSLRGLEQLTAGASVDIEENPKLENFRGLDALAKLTGNLTLRKNSALTSFDGLDALTNVSGMITMAENTALPQTAIEAFLKRLGR